jgi:hypothetical protein
MMFQVAAWKTQLGVRGGNRTTRRRAPIRLSGDGTKPTWRMILRSPLWRALRTTNAQAEFFAGRSIICALIPPGDIDRRDCIAMKPRRVMVVAKFLAVLVAAAYVVAVFSGVLPT